jgi:hypothetical protein
MAQGYLLTMTINAQAVQFQNVGVRITADEIDTSSSLNSNGTPNPGVSDVFGDLKTLFCEIGTVIKDPIVTALMGAFIPGTRYGFAWTITYGARTYSGSYFYVQEHNLDASIPGAARFRMTFRSVQSPGSGINGFLIS